MSVFLFTDFFLNIKKDLAASNYLKIILYYLGFVSMSGISTSLLYCITLGYIKSYIMFDGKLTRKIVWNSSKQYILKILGYSFQISFLILSGFLFFVIPGIYLSVILCLVLIIVVLEDIKLDKSITRSMYLIKNYWWSTLGGLIIVYMIFYFCSILLSLPNYIVSFLFGLFNLQNSETLRLCYKFLHIFFIIFSSFGQIFICIPIIYLSFHYHNLIERKKDFKLIDEIENISTELK
jgi:hypothetical protein